MKVCHIKYAKPLLNILIYYWIMITKHIPFLGAPHVTVTPQGPLIVYPGQRVSFECIAEGEPLATVYWQSPHGYRVDSVGLSGTENTALLSIDRVTADDAGTYTCFASNDVGRSTGTIDIRGQCTGYLLSVPHYVIICMGTKEGY